MVEPTALHRVKCQEFGCTYQMLAISDLRYEFDSILNFNPHYSINYNYKIIISLFLIIIKQK